MDMEINKIYDGDCLKILKTFPDESINCCVTSPPYWALRDYGVDGQLGLEQTFTEYVNKLCNVFDEVKRVLKKNGTCWVNLGDSYFNTRVKDNAKQNINDEPSGHPLTIDYQGIENKSLCNIPARFSIEMQNRGWILRNVIIWHKPNCVPCSVKDRFTVDFEYVFFFVKSKKYYFNQQFEIMKQISIDRAKYSSWGIESKSGQYKKLNGLNSRYNPKPNPNGRNKRTVWMITTKPFKELHFATYPEELCYTPIKAGCPENGIVLDPFIGSGTTGVVALKQNKKFVGIELNKEYIEIANKRLEPYLKQSKLI